MKVNINTMNTNTEHDDFKAVWERRQQWQGQAEKSAPDDATFLRWAEKVQQSTNGQEGKIIQFSAHRSNRWIPYAAAACIAIGVFAVGLNHHGETGNNLPVAKEVKVGGQTVRFLCNNGCSAQDVLLSANEVIK